MVFLVADVESKTETDICSLFVLSVLVGNTRQEPISGRSLFISWTVIPPDVLIFSVPVRASKQRV